MDFLGGFGILFSVLPVGLIVLAIVAVAGRREPDPTGARLYVFYLAAVTFVALFVVLFSLFATTSALSRLAFDRDPFGDPFGQFDVPVREDMVESEIFAPEDEFDVFVEGPSLEELPPPRGFDRESGVALLGAPPGPHIRDALLPAIVGFLGALVLVFHARRLREVTRAPGFANGGTLRTYLAYLYAVCFASIVIALGAAAAALFALVRAAFPDVGDFPGEVERNRAWVDLVSGTVLAAASAAVFSFHWRRAAALRPESSAGPEPTERVS
jgi:hypothetical protein